VNNLTTEGNLESYHEITEECPLALFSNFFFSHIVSLFSPGGHEFKFLLLQPTDEIFIIINAWS
jgi:hypothetical protein